MRIVVKVGTSTLTHTSGRINIRRTEKLCKILSDVKNAGHELILVSSGAIGMGVGKLNMKSKPEDMPTKQAAAAIGQCELMYLYVLYFTPFSYTKQEADGNLFSLIRNGEYNAELGIRSWELAMVRSAG